MLSLKRKKISLFDVLIVVLAVVCIVGVVSVFIVAIFMHGIWPLWLR